VNPFKNKIFPTKFVFLQALVSWMQTTEETDTIYLVGFLLSMHLKKFQINISYLVSQSAS